MKYLQATISFCLMLATNAAIASSSPTLDYVERVAKQIDYIEQQQQAVWPGFHPASTPSVIQFEGGETLDTKIAYALNFKPGALPWQKLTESEHLIYFLPDATVLNLEGDEGFAVVDGQASYIDGEYTKSFAEKENFVNRFITKRAMYYFAREAAIDHKQVSALRVPFDNFNNTVLLKLYLLEDAALTASQQSDAGLAEDALRDAVAIHQFRNQLSTPSARAYENANEIISGTPYYIGWTSKQLNDEDFKKMSQRTGCTPLSGTTGPFGLIDCVQNGFLAFTSSVYGHALDKKLLGHPWKQDVEKQFKSISQIIINYYHLSDQQAKTIVAQAIKKPAYHYDRIERVVNYTMVPYVKNMRAVVTAYQAMQGPVLRLPSGFGEALIIMGIFKRVFTNVYIVDSTKILLQDVTITIPLHDESNKSSTDEIVFNHLPYVPTVTVPMDFDGKADPVNSFTAIKLMPQSRLVLDGVSMLASDFVRARKVQAFRQLVIADSRFRFSIKLNAVLSAKDGTLRLTGPGARESEKINPVEKYVTELKQRVKAAAGH